jgi:hypothetical protein
MSRCNWLAIVAVLLGCNSFAAWAAEPALAPNPVPNPALNPTINRLIGPAKSVAQADAILAQQLPNVNPLFGQQAGRGIATRPVDHSQQLMEVITSCIAPTTWDVNGGQGAVRYYAPSQALVVRQTSEIHEQLLRVLPKLRQ